MEIIKNIKIADLIAKYKCWLSGALMLFVVAELVYLLWHANYFLPEMQKRISVLEERVALIEKDDTGQGRQIEIDKLIAESSEPAESADNGKVAGAQTPSQQVPATSKQQSQIAGKININSASASELDQLPGIGPAYANRIIEYRNKSKFNNIEEIKKIKGIGDATFNKIKDKITI